MKRLFLHILVVGFICSFVSCFNVQAQTDYYGVHATELTSVSLAALERVASMLDSANIRWVRMNFAWGEIQPTSSVWQWHDWVQRVNLLRSHNINVLGLLYKIPDWASSAPNGTNPILIPFYPPRDTLEWMTYIDSTVITLKGLITHFEIWTEEDGGFFYAPVANTKPGKFFEILRSSCTAVKKANPSATVLIGGFTSQVGTLLKSVFLDSLFAMGASQYFDIMNVHYYRYEDDPIGAVRTVMKRYNKNAPVWVTETNNWRSLLSVNTEQRAADSLPSWMTSLRNQKPDKIFWFSLTDFTGGRSNDSIAWGLFRKATFTPTLVYDALRKYITQTTDVRERDDAVPNTSTLEQNYPNPFSERTSIRFEIGDWGHGLSEARLGTQIPNLKSQITFKVFDLLGREVLDLSDEANRNSEIVIRKSQLPSPGVYIYRIQNNSFVQSKIMVML